MVYEMARDFHSRGSESFGSRVCGCIWCLICIGPLLTIIGLALLVGSLTDTRSPNIELYNDDVNSWTNQYSAEFQAAQNVQWQSNFPYIGEGEFAIPSTTTDTPLDDTGKSGDKTKIATYQPFLLQHTVTVDLSQVCSSFNGCSDPSRTSGEVKITTNSLDALTVTQSAYLVEYSDKRTCDIDEWNTAQGCAKYWILSGVCVKVQNTSGRWSLDSTNGGAGCGESKDWRSGSYSLQFTPTTPTRVPVKVTVRSNKDPRVGFYQIEGAGSALNFGLSQMEKALMGIVLLSIGGAITCGLIAAVKFCLKGGSSSTTVYQPVTSQPIAQSQPVYNPGTYNQGGQNVQPQQQGYYPPQQQQYQQPMQQQQQYQPPMGQQYPPQQQFQQPYQQGYN